MGPIEKHDLARKVSLSQYESVLARAIDTAGILIKNPSSENTEKYRYIHKEAEKLLSAYPVPLTVAKDESVVSEIFSKLVLEWPGLDISALWSRFMNEFPLGEYASMAADILLKENLLKGPVLEIGAGVGNTSRLVCHHLDSNNYLRTDLNVKLLKEHPYASKIAQYDFNKKGRWDNLSCIFGVNALHCASDKTQSLRHLYQMLAPGGALLISEGAPEPLPGKPWALNYLCGFFDGWSDQGGFLTREKWFKHLTEAGLENIHYARMTAGENDLGGVIWAKKKGPVGPFP